MVGSILGEAKARAVIALASALRRAPSVAARRALLARLSRTGYFAGEYDHPFEITTKLGARMCGRTKDLIQAHLYAFGEWEPDLSHFVRRRLQPGDTFVDVGANIGWFTLLAAQAVGPTGRVVALEASPATHRELAVNVALGAFAQVRLVNEAASDTEGWLQLHQGPAWNSGMSSTVAPERWQTAGVDARFQSAVEVPARPLDRLLSARERAALRLVKIDVEGAELRVVRGMTAILAEAPPALEVVVEINPSLLAAQGQDASEVIRTFADAGLHAYALPADYGEAQYLRADPRAPLRLRGPLQGTADVVFSRTDAEHLAV